METFEITEYNDEIIRVLHERYHLRPREIGSYFGKEESSVRLRIKAMGLALLPRDVKRADVQIVCKYVPKKKAQDMETQIVALIGMGWDDKKIATHLGIEYHRVSYFRKFKLQVGSSYNQMSEEGERVRSVPLEDLKRDYFSLSKADLGAKYSLAPETIRKYLREANIESKRKHLRGEVVPLTRDQVTLVMGSMLGDAGISDGRYREFHCFRQRPYLASKHAVLVPHARPIRVENAGCSFQTFKHPALQAIEKEFYKEGVRGKHIPVQLLVENWDVRMLAYWYLDDGSYDSATNTMSISNKCPDESQLAGFLQFLESRYHWGFKYIKNATSGMFYVTVEKAYYRDFFDVVVQVAPPCMLYKVPTDSVPQGAVTAKVMEDVPLDHITSGMYLAMSEEDKEKTHRSMTEFWASRSFPYVSLTEDRARADYLSAVRSLNSEGCTLNGDNVHILTKSPGSRLLEWMFPNMYECRRRGYKSPLESWNDKDKLGKLVLNRLQHADGAINESAMRKGIKLHWGAVYNFRTATAAQVYKAFNANGVVLDYSAGFGARMTAANALGLTYYGYEPNTKTYANLVKLHEWSNSNGNKAPAVLHNVGSELIDIPAGTVGVAFSSPPYFDVESYGDEPTQSISKYPRKDQWLEGYWAETVRRSVKALVSGGVFAVCLSPYSCQDIMSKTDEVCTALGLTRIREIRVPIGRLLQGDSDGYEVIWAYSMSNSFRSTPVHGASMPVCKKEEAPIIQTIKVASKEDVAEKLRIEEAELASRKETCLGFSWKFKKNTRAEADVLFAEGKIGYSGADIERMFGTWNGYLRAAGKPLNREFFTEPLDNLKQYLEHCLSMGGYRSPYQMSQETGSNTLALRVKRLFAPNGKLRGLVTGLETACVSKQAMEEFLEEASKLLR